jgi:hypothetical protein
MTFLMLSFSKNFAEMDGMASQEPTPANQPNKIPNHELQKGQ